MPSPASLIDKTVAVIGGGPAGLMAADIISGAGVKVNVYDTMPSVGRKFLMAGKGGLNITHSEPYQYFMSRYGKNRNDLQPALDNFGANDVTAWMHRLGIQTFVGSSGRVFPAEMKAAPLLRAWLRRLRRQGVQLHVRHRWLGWEAPRSKALRFRTTEGIKEIEADAIVLALGGASWPQLGSTGEWVPMLSERGVRIAALAPSNCGFNTDWSEHFRRRFAGHPLKSIVASCADIRVQGDCVITESGLEGGLIYSLSTTLRKQIANTGAATLYLDLAPHRPLSSLLEKFSRPRGKQSLSSHLRKCLGIDGVKAGLLREIVPADRFNDPMKVCSAIKSLPVGLVSPRPIAEAISSAGGVCFDALDGHLMINALPGVFCAGEMLDWDAPTGGYLLTACFATGRMAGEGVLNWLSAGKSLFELPK